MRPRFRCHLLRLTELESEPPPLCRATVFYQHRAESGESRVNLVNYGVPESPLLLVSERWAPSYARGDTHLLFAI